MTDALMVVSGWTARLGGFAIATTVVVLVTWTMATMLRGAAAELRSLIWTAGLTSALIVPVLPLPAIDLDMGEVATSGNPPAPPTESLTEATSGWPAPIAESPVAIDPSATPDIAALLIGLFGLIWLAGTTLMLLRIARGLIHRSARSSDLEVVEHKPWRDAVTDVGREMGIRRSIRILTGRSVTGPHTWGLLRPTVVVPDDDAIDDDWRRAIVRHELAHVARLDTMRLGAERTLEACYWWNPLVRFAVRRAHLEREYSCDDSVIGSGGRPSRYARQLLTQARSLARPAVGLVPALPRTETQLSRRIRRILDPDTPRRKPAKPLALALLLPIIATACSVSALQSEAEPLNEAEPGVRITTEGDAVDVNIVSDDGALTAEISGDMTLSSTDDLESLSQDGVMTIEDERAEPSRRITVTSNDSGLVHDYVLDGQDHAFDAAGREWFHAVLLETIRHSGVNAERRVERIFRDGGATGVVDEVREIPSDLVRRLYLEHALSHAAPDASAMALIVGAASLLTSDFERAQVLGSAASFIRDTGSVLDAWLDGVEGMSSDFERAAVLRALLTRPDTTAGLRIQTIEVAAQLDSDFEKAQVLVEAADRLRGSEAERAAYLASARTITSDFERGRALTALDG